MIELKKACASLLYLMFVDCASSVSNEWEIRLSSCGEETFSETLVCFPGKLAELRILKSPRIDFMNRNWINSHERETSHWQFLKKETFSQTLL